MPDLRAYLTGYWLSDFSNFAAFVYHSLPELNWVGFYFFDGNMLRLGPFVGRPACTEIRPGRGVCGQAFSSGRALIVPNVEEFPGHITCDSRSRAELVLPIVVGSLAVGVLDLDSPVPGRFSEADLEGLSLWLSVLVEKISADTWADWPQALGANK